MVFRTSIFGFSLFIDNCLRQWGYCNANSGLSAVTFVFAFAFTFIILFSRVVDQGCSTEPMDVSVSRFGAILYKVYMSSISYKNCRAGGAAEFMEMSINGIGTERNFVHMAVAGADSFFGNGSKTMGMTFVASSSGDGTSDKFVNMLVFITTEVCGFSAERTGFQTESTVAGFSGKITGFSITIGTIAHIKALL